MLWMKEPTVRKSWPLTRDFYLVNEIQVVYLGITEISLGTLTSSHSMVSIEPHTC